MSLDADTNNTMATTIKPKPKINDFFIDCKDMTYSLNQHTIGILVQLGVKMHTLYKRCRGFKNPSIGPLAC